MNMQQMNMVSASKLASQVLRTASRTSSVALGLAEPVGVGINGQVKCDDGLQFDRLERLRKQLGAVFAPVRFFVHRGEQTELCIAWVDGPNENSVYTALKAFSSSDRDICVGGSSLHMKRQLTGSLVRRAVALVWARYPGQVKDIVKPTPEALANGHYYGCGVPGTGACVDEIVYQTIDELISQT